MATRFVYGSYVSKTCIVRGATRSITPRFTNNFAVSYIWTLTFDIEISEATTADIVSETIALRQALETQGLSGGLQFYDGSSWLNTDHFLNAFGAIGGVTVTQQGLGDSPLQLATEQRFTLQMQAEYANLNETRTLLQFDESVEITGEGGADTVLVEQAAAPGFYQTVQQYTPVQVVQSGRAVGRTGFPALPGFVITTAGARKVRVTRDRKSYEMKGTSIIGFVREYSFTFILPSHPGSIIPNYLT